MQNKKNQPPIIIYITKNENGYDIDRSQSQKIRIPSQPVVMKPQLTQPTIPQSSLQIETIQPIDFKKQEKETQQKKFPIIMPSCSQWFSLDSIHQIEKENLPEFFENRPSKSPEIYMNYRNFMVNSFRENSKNYLTATWCRKFLAGDACAIIRIHAFLEHWGLINFNVEMQNRQDFMNKSSNVEIFRYSKGCESLEFYDETLTQQQKELVLDSVKMLGRNYQPFCDFCGLECQFLWYQFKKHVEIPEMNICSDCFQQNKYPSFISPSEFKKIDIMEVLQKNNQHLQDNWSLDETSKLLDLIKKYQNNWIQIQQEFGDGKTKEELMIHFMQLPIKNITKIKFEQENKNSYQNINQVDPSVYGDYSNPILQHVSIFKSLLENINKELVQQSPIDEKLMQIEENTKENCKYLAQKEESKIKSVVNVLIDLQLNKLELKMNHLEEIEKIIWTERNNLEQLQNTILAEHIQVSAKILNNINNNMEIEH